MRVGLLNCYSERTATLGSVSGEAGANALRECVDNKMFTPPPPQKMAE
ncbi:MAG: hypothetical protein LBR84_07775 [Tannerella sp.]|jgi:hypothetical protein|nr:hypothetical protein [Tannerella sp.]